MLAVKTMIIAVLPLAAMGVSGQDTPGTQSAIQQVAAVPATQANRAAQASVAQTPSQAPATTQTGQRKSARTATVQPSRIPADVRAKAAHEVSGGNFEGALTVYDEASRTASATGDTETASEAKARYARAVEQWVNIDAKQGWRLTEAQNAYKQAAFSGTPTQKAVALNNLASLFLRQKQVADAIGTFRQIDFAALPRDQVHIVHYNYARAFETAPNMEASYGEYREALNARPGYVPAADGALRVLRLMPPTTTARVQDCIALGNQLLSQGLNDQALSSSLLGLQYWTQGPGRDDLLLLLARSLAAAGLDSKNFADGIAPRLRDQALAERFGKEFGEINVAYSGALWPSLSPSPGNNLLEKILPTWSHSYSLRPGMSALLSAIGQAYGRAGNKDEAIARYELAWLMDSHNVEAAVYAADVLRENSARYSHLLEPLIEPLFTSKSLAYQSNDLPNIYRLHMVLGTYFEAQRQWGDSGNPRSAIFQFENAAATARRLQAKDKDFPPVPGLHSRLAAAYQQAAASAPASRKDELEKKAWSEYLAAAQEFVKSSNAEAATGALKQARKLPIQPTMEMEGSFVGIQSAIARIAGTV